jgi:hypothetical protein
MFGEIIFEFNDGFFEIDFVTLDISDLVPLGLALLGVAVALGVVLAVRRWGRSGNARES